MEGRGAGAARADGGGEELHRHVDERHDHDREVEHVPRLADVLAEREGAVMEEGEEVVVVEERWWWSRWRRR